MDFTGKLTRQGQALLAKTLTGGTLTVTRVLAGSGQTGENAVGLADPRQTATISQRTADGSLATIMVTLSAGQAEGSYTLTELGVYATDPDQGEILYEVFRLDTPVEIAPDSRLVIRTYLRMAASDQLSVSLAFPPSGLLTEADVQNKADLVHGQVPYAQTPHLTGNVTLYVNGATGSDTNPGTQEAPFATIQAAVDSLPRDLSGKNVAIVIAPGTYAEDVMIGGFYGAGDGYMELRGEPRGTHPTGDSGARKIRSIAVAAAGLFVDIFGMYLYGNRASRACAFYCAGGAGVFLEYCTILSSGSSYGVRVGPNAQCYSYMNAMISGTSGEKFTYGFYMEAGAFLHIGQTSIGGCITGVANPAVGEIGGIVLVGYNVAFNGVMTEYYKLRNNGVIIRNGSEFV